jgi:hypothetical protein
MDLINSYKCVRLLTEKSIIITRSLKLSLKLFFFPHKYIAFNPAKNLILLNISLFIFYRYFVLVLVKFLYVRINPCNIYTIYFSLYAANIEMTKNKYSIYYGVYSNSDLNQFYKTKMKQGSK